MLTSLWTCVINLKWALHCTGCSLGKEQMMNTDEESLKFQEYKNVLAWCPLSPDVQQPWSIKIKTRLLSGASCIIHKVFSAVLPSSGCWSLMWCFNFDGLTQSGVKQLWEERKSSLKVKVSESDSAHAHTCLSTDFVRANCVNKGQIRLP